LLNASLYELWVHWAYSCHALLHDEEILFLNMSY